VEPPARITPPAGFTLQAARARRQHAIAILLAVPARKPHRTDCGLAQLTRPDGSAALIDQLRAGGTVLTYEPASRTLRADGHDAPSVVIGKDATDTHARQNKERRTA
jgi:hypothetical protein